MFLASLSIIGLTGCEINTVSEEAQLKEMQMKLNYNLEIKRIEKGYGLQEGDLDNNGINEKFYTIGENLAIMEYNGKPVLELLKKVKQ
ncbi:MAG: hypothetical protein ABFQ65_02425 [Nanoarchaeota archaeon]